MLKIQHESVEEEREKDRRILNTYEARVEQMGKRVDKRLAQIEEIINNFEGFFGGQEKMEKNIMKKIEEESKNLK